MSSFNQVNGYAELFNEGQYDFVNSTIENLTVTESLDVTGAQIIGFPVDDITLEFSNNILQVKDGGISDVKISDMNASKLAGTVTINVNNINTTSNNMNTDIINEKTEDAGVTIEGVLIKDGEIVSLNEISLNDGSLLNPSFSYVNEEGLGLYRKSLNNIAFASDGINPLTINNIAILPHVQTLFPSTGQVAPAISFITDPGTGIYGSAGNVRIVTNQNIAFECNNTENISYRQMQVSPFYGASFSSPQYADSVRTNTGLFIYNTASLGLSLVVIGEEKLNVRSTFTESFQQLRLIQGGAVNLSLQIGANLTGFYENVSNRLVIMVNGTETFEISQTAIYPKVQSLFPSSGQVAPAISFASDPGTGIYGSAGNVRIVTSQNIAFECNNTENISYRQMQVSPFYGASFSSPQYADSVRTNTGLFIYNTASLGLSLIVSASEKLNVRSTYTQSLQPFYSNTLDSISGDLVIGTNNASSVNIGSIVAPVIIEGTLETDIIQEKTLNNGVVIEQIILKDNTIDTSAPTALTIGGTTQTALNLGRSGITTENKGIFSNTLGSATNPSYTFTGDTNTGLYSPSADAINITTGGVRRAVFGGLMVLYMPLQFQAGQAGSNPITIQATSNDVLAFATTTNYFFSIINSTNTGNFNGFVNFNNGLRTNVINGLTGTTMNIGTVTSTGITLGYGTIPVTINTIDLVYQRPTFDIYYENINNTTACINPNTYYFANLGAGSLNTTLARSFSISLVGRITYTYSKSKYLHITSTVSFTDTKQANDIFSLYKNGVKVDGSSVVTSAKVGFNSLNMQKIVLANPNDYFELYISSSIGNNDITISYINILGFILENTP